VCWSVPDCSAHEPQVLTQESDTDCLWAGWTDVFVKKIAQYKAQPIFKIKINN
jgi:hypothetical protein